MGIETVGLTKTPVTESGQSDYTFITTLSLFLIYFSVLPLKEHLMLLHLWYVHAYITSCMHNQTMSLFLQSGVTANILSGSSTNLTTSQLSQLLLKK